MGFSLKKIGKFVGKLATGDILGAAGTVIGAVAGSKGSKKAAKASAASNEAAAQEQRNALMRVGQVQQPYLDAGSPAVNALMRVNAGDYSGFESSPDFLAAQKFGTQAVERSAAARGGLNSGNTLIDLNRFGADNATRYLGNYRTALTQQAGIGQSAANNYGDAVLGTGAGVGNALIGAGDARASGILGSTNAITGTLEDLGRAADDFEGNRLIKKAKAPAVKLKPRNIGPY